MKPTTIMANYDLGALALRCDRDVRPHEHEPLKGKVQVDGHWVYRTRLAQVYPVQLCVAWASLIPGKDPLEATFGVTTPDRKRPLGQAMPWKPHRQRDTAERAQAAGYQLKRAAVPPLLQVEMEPGQAVRTALEIPHPFSLEPPLPPDLQEALAMAVLHPEATLKHRSGALEYWGRRAEQLLPVTDQLLQTLPDPHLRRLLRGCPDGEALQLGSCTHIALWRELMAAARCVDVGLLDDMLHGFPIIGPVARSGRWARLSAPAVLSETDLHERAWEFFSKVSRNVERAELTEYSGKVWEATMEDVAEKVTVGPFYSEAEVSSFVGTKVWVPTQRFEVVQKNKVRGVDSATTNGVNMATEVQEKLDLPSTDLNVAALRWIRTHLPAECHVEGWVLDERKAYRQIPIRPGHRRWSPVERDLAQRSGGREGSLLCHDRPLFRVGVSCLQLQ